MEEDVLETGLSDIAGSLAGIVFLLPLVLGEFLALDAAQRPWHSGEASGANRFLAVEAVSEDALVKPAERRPHLTQQTGLAVYGLNRQIAFRRILNLIHLIGAFLDLNAVPAQQSAGQLGLLSFEDLQDPSLFIGCVYDGPLS